MAFNDDKFGKDQEGRKDNKDNKGDKKENDSRKMNLERFQYEVASELGLDLNRVKNKKEHQDSPQKSE